jgi:hypothetical protein
MEITDNELKLIRNLLQMATFEFGKHGCNDVDDEIYAGWTLNERKAFVKGFYEYNGDPENYNETNLHLPDYALMGFMAAKLNKIVGL